MLDETELWNEGVQPGRDAQTGILENGKKEDPRKSEA